MASSERSRKEEVQEQKRKKRMKEEKEMKVEENLGECVLATRERRENFVRKERKKEGGKETLTGVTAAGTC